MWSMGVTAPLSVATAGGKFVLQDDRDTPDTMQAVYEFGPARHAPKGFTHTYTMRKAAGPPWSRGGYGMDLHGTMGHCHIDRSVFKVDADEKNWPDWKNQEKRTEDVEDRSGNDGAGHLAHVHNFLACVQNRRTPIASIERHYNTVVACHLANVSLKVGNKIFWDAEKELCYADAAHKHPYAEANKHLDREYRKGYEIPDQV